MSRFQLSALRLSSLLCIFGAGTVPLTAQSQESIAAEACPISLPCETTVTSGAELAAALTNAVCGCEIMLADGAYSGNFVLQKSCPADQPIVIRAQNPLAPLVSSILRLEGSNATVHGLTFMGLTAGIVVGGTANKVLRNRFTGWKGLAIRATRGNDVEIAYNEFFSPAPFSSGGKQRIALFSGEKNGGLHRNAWVYGNYFHDFPPKPTNVYSSGQSDAIEICGGNQDLSDVSSEWMIERNLIQRHLGTNGLIDIKCGGTSVISNTLVASPGGRMDIRSGSNSVVAANWLEDSGGMVIHGGYHQLLGNRLIRSGGIVLAAGTTSWDYAGPNRLPDGTQVHQASYNLLVSGNTSGSLMIGKKYDLRHVYPAESTVVEQHTGTIKYGLHQNTTVLPLASLTIPAAVRLTEANVGPLADGGCQ